MSRKKNSRPRPRLRNAGPYRSSGKPYQEVQRSFRPPPPPRYIPEHEEFETPGQRIAYTAAGAIGTSLSGVLFARMKWKPETIATVLAALGAGFALRGDSATLRSVGAGTMAAAGGQLSLIILEKNMPEKKEEVTSEKKPANADELPQGALEAALERARARMAMTEHAGDYT